MKLDNEEDFTLWFNADLLQLCRRVKLKNVCVHVMETVVQREMKSKNDGLKVMELDEDLLASEPYLWVEK